MASLAQPAQSNTSLAVTVSATFNNNPTQGNLLIAVVTASVGTGSISLSNSGWSTGISVAVGATGGMIVFYKVAVAGSDKTVTANATLAAFMDIQIFEYDGIDNASPLDLTASTADSGTGVTSRASGTTGTLAQSIELAFAAVAMDGANGGGASWTNSYNAELTTTHLITADLTTSATTAQSTTGSWTNSVRAAGVILTFLGETGDSVLRLPPKPSVVKLSLSSSLTKGLINDIPLFEKGGTSVLDIAVNLFSVVTGASWITVEGGRSLSFSGSSNKIATNLTSSPDYITYQFILYRTGNGSSSFPRIFDKPSECDLFYDVGTATAQITQSFSTGSKTFKWSNMILNTLENHIIVYDRTSNSNSPSVWVNGVPVTVSIVSDTSSGSHISNSNVYTIGNNAAQTRDWQGRIYLFRVWNRLLSKQEVELLSFNPWQIYVKPGLLNLTLK